MAGPVPNGSGLRRRKRKKSELGAEGSRCRVGVAVAEATLANQLERWRELF